MMLQKVFLFSCLILNVFTQDVNIDNYRLPKDVESVSYNLTLEPDILNLIFKGTLVFTFKPLRNVPKLILNSKNLLFDLRYVVIEDDEGNNIPLKLMEEQKEYERLIVSPASSFSEGRIYSILFKYQGNITEDGAGLYRSSYTDNYGVKQWMLVSQMRPVHTRKVFPCLDEPSFRARFRLAVWHHPSYEVISNMPAIQTTLIGSEAAVTEFDETPPIPVFLTGLLVSRLDVVAGVRGFRSLAIPQEVKAAAYSAQIGPQLAGAMESLVHIPYPQVKTHQVALPRLVPVAMENWGLFNFRKENILYEPGVSPTVQKQTAARFSGHEVAHAWLGNSVTIAWWDYLWLSEMFAMYLEYFLPHVVNPKWRMDEQMVVDLQLPGLAEDSPSADPLTTTVLTPQQISNKFMGLTYTKGPGLLRMVQNVLSLGKFFKGIQTYLEKHWGGSVTPGDLWSCLESQGSFPTRLGTIMSTWTDQPGYPLIDVSFENGVVHISQSPYLSDEKTRSNGSWWVPLSYVTSLNEVFDSRPKVWLPPEHIVTVPVPAGALFLLNIHSSGFYRVNYGEDLWARLTYELHKNHEAIPPLNRAQLVDDAFALAKSGHLRVGIALGLASYLSAEDDFIVWKSASGSLLSFADLLINSEIYPLYKKYVLALVEKVFKTSGLLDSVHEEHVDQVRREVVTTLACRMGNQNCINAATEYISQLLQGRPLSVSPNVKASLLCTGVKEGNAQIWRNILTLYSKETQDKSQYLSALACSNDPALLETLLITESAINDDEWKAIYAAFSGRRENADNLLNTLHKNINKIISRFGTKGLSGFISQISSFLTTKSQTDLLADMERLGVGDLKEVRRGIELKINWLKSNIPSIVEYFKINKNFALLVNT